MWLWGFILHKIINSSTGVFTVLQILALNTVSFAHFCTASRPAHCSPTHRYTCCLQSPSQVSKMQCSSPQSMTPNSSDENSLGERGKCAMCVCACVHACLHPCSPLGSWAGRRNQNIPECANTGPGRTREGLKELHGYLRGIRLNVALLLSPPYPVYSAITQCLFFFFFFKFCHIHRWKH